ncbi:hypothetical protein AAFO90_17500 [Phaeobacter sp. CAU 1743]|uniref:hypothetical protein n=1 Tax=Phaeobacter sp. CAU 1743 TaxID=3140367 RepID=UPI00325AB99C
MRTFAPDQAPPIGYDDTPEGVFWLAGFGGLVSKPLLSWTNWLLRYSPNHRSPSPSGRHWGASPPQGNRQRGTDIVNNGLYIGRQAWNRLRYVKDPQTGERTLRLNPDVQSEAFDILSN